MIPCSTLLKRIQKAIEHPYEKHMLLFYLPEASLFNSFFILMPHAPKP